MVGGVIWGTVFLVIGISILVSVLFGINIPIFRILAGLAIIYLGILFITGMSHESVCEHFCRKCNGKTAGQHVFIGKGKIAIDPKQFESEKLHDYSTVFGTSHIDLSDLEQVDEALRPLEIEVNTIFGGSKVTLNPKLPVKIISSSAFGKTEFPDDSSVNFGSYTYKSYSEEKPHLIIRTNTVFGKLEIEKE